MIPCSFRTSLKSHKSVSCDFFSRISFTSTSQRLRSPFVTLWCKESISWIKIHSEQQLHSVCPWPENRVETRRGWEQFLELNVFSTSQGHKLTYESPASYFASLIILPDVGFIYAAGGFRRRVKSFYWFKLPMYHRVYWELLYLASSHSIFPSSLLTPIMNVVWYVTANLSSGCMISCHLLVCPWVFLIWDNPSQILWLCVWTWSISKEAI